MSLDINLYDTPVIKIGTGVFVRDKGATRELTTLEEVRKYFPDSDLTGIEERVYETDEVFDTNITHNLGRMAEAAGVYTTMWCPDEIEGDTAKKLIEPLASGYANLLADPDKFKEFNPENGWGNYEQLVECVKDYLVACLRYPNAIIKIDK